MTIEEKQVFIDEIIGMIEDYLFEKDIDMKSDVATQIVIRAASSVGWLNMPLIRRETQNGATRYARTWASCSILWFGQRAA